MAENSVIPVLHNVSSVQRVTDAARLAYTLGYEVLVITKAYGGAAQSGVPEAMRLALRGGRSLIVLPGLEDAVELLSPDRVVLVSRDYARSLIDPLKPGASGGRLMLVVSGGEPEFTAAEAKLGEPVYFEGVEGKLGALAELSLLLYAYRRVGKR